MKNTAVEPRALKAAAHVARNERTRYAFDQVRVYTNGLVEATDGHMAVRIQAKAHTEWEPPQNGFVPDETTEHAALPLNFSKDLARDCYQPAVIRTDANGVVNAIKPDLTSQHAHQVEGSYPDISRLTTPKSTECRSVAFSLAVLDKLVKAMKAVTGLPASKHGDAYVRLLIPKGRPKYDGHVGDTILATVCQSGRSTAPVWPETQFLICPVQQGGAPVKERRL